MNSVTLYVLSAFVFALVAAMVLTPYARAAAEWAGAVRTPRDRDMHAEPMPLWGGLAIVISTLAVFVALVPVHGSTQMIGIVLGGLVICGIGLLDDCWDLSAAQQIAGISVAAGIAIALGLRIEFVSNPMGGEVDLGWFSVPLTFVWIFAITKAVDFIDGLDGLAAGIGAIASGTLAFMALTTHQLEIAVFAAVLSGACLGFLRHNFNPARIFMGTAGAQFIGFSLSCIAITGLFKTAATLAISLPVLVLGVPVFDALFVTTRRALRGQPLFTPEKAHVHHLLVKSGLSHRQAVLVLYVVSIGFSMIAWQVFRGGLS